MTSSSQSQHRSGSEMSLPVPGGGATVDFVPPTAGALAALFPQLEIIDLIGCGGMGAVYKARQKRLDRLVALKIIRPGVTHERAFAERFHREAKTLARLSHQHIVAIHDFGEVDYTNADDPTGTALYFFIMEHVDGSNLRQVIATETLSPRDALAIVPQICDALQYAHDEGVVHRDIKPENILIDKRGRVKIADFGLAKLMARSSEELTITGTHQVMGTPRYMAPEQMEASHAVDHRADIYSLGVVFYEMLTGDVPAGHFEPPSQRVQVDVRLDEVVLRSLAQRPERRYQHASEVKTDVELITNSFTLPGAAEARQLGEARPKPGPQRAPTGFAVASLALFAFGWGTAGALRHLGIAGLAVAICLLGLLTYAVIRWKLSHMPELRSALAAASPGRRTVVICASALLFAVAILSCESFLVNLLDWHYFARVGNVPGAVSTMHRGGRLADLEIPATLAGELERAARLHRERAIGAGTKAILWGALSLLLLSAAPAVLLSTSLYQRSWRHHLQPAFQVTSLLALSLCMVVVVFVLIDQKKGWALSYPSVFTCRASVDNFQARVQQWASRNGYDRQLNIYGGQGELTYASYRLQPRSTLDRWQFEPRYLVRPLPPISVTAVEPGGAAHRSTTVLIELPWVGMESPEETRWPVLVSSLQQSIEASAPGDSD